ETNSLIGSEEKCFVLPVVELGNHYRAARSDAKLILAIGGDAGLKGISGIEGVVTEKFEDRAMQRIAARFCYDVDYSAQYSAKFSLIIVRVDFELFDLVDDGSYGV